jgi:tRNA pseudouridine55 synthase
LSIEIEEILKYFPFYDKIYKKDYEINQWGRKMKSGIVILNKEEGLSSFAAVSQVRRIMGAEKAGHTGTLDPMATGVLPILLGRAVKASEYMLTEDKHYIARMLIGIETDTEDITGKIISECESIPDEDLVFSTINSMVGESMQIPPMFSALKVGGKKLYDLAREGKTVERAPRKINIYEINAKKISDREYELDVKCSKGTYIRTLCADIGKKLGTGAVMSALLRASAACFTLSDAYTLTELEGMSEEEKEAAIFPVEYIFRDKRKVVLQPFFARLARSGVEIYLKKIGFCAKDGELITMHDEKGFFALGEVRNFDTGLAIKPIKQFDTQNS